MVRIENSWKKPATHKKCHGKEEELTDCFCWIGCTPMPRYVKPDPVEEYSLYVTHSTGYLPLGSPESQEIAIGRAHELAQNGERIGGFVTVHTTNTRDSVEHQLRAVLDGINVIEGPARVTVVSHSESLQRFLSGEQEAEGIYKNVQRLEEELDTQTESKKIELWCTTPDSDDEEARDSLYYLQKATQQVRRAFEEGDIDENLERR